MTEIPPQTHTATRLQDHQGHCDFGGCHNVGLFFVEEMDSDKTEYLCFQHLISELVPRAGYVSIQVSEEDYEEMLKDADTLTYEGRNVVYHYENERGET